MVVTWLRAAKIVAVQYKRYSWNGRYSGKCTCMVIYLVAVVVVVIVLLVIVDLLEVVIIEGPYSCIWPLGHGLPF